MNQLQEKYIKSNTLCTPSFVHVKRTFDRVPHRMLWWTMGVTGVPEWIAAIVQLIYIDAKNRLRASSLYRDEFEVKVGIHHGSVLSMLLFTIVLEVLSEELPMG